MSSHDVAAFKSWSHEGLRESLAVLDEAHTMLTNRTLPACKYEDIEFVTGLNRNPDGLLASRELAAHFNPAEACTYDWVHNMLQDGVFSVEMSAFLRTAGVSRLDVSRICHRIAPSGIGVQGCRLRDAFEGCRQAVPGGP